MNSLTTACFLGLKKCYEKKFAMLFQRGLKNSLWHTCSEVFHLICPYCGLTFIPFSILIFELKFICKMSNIQELNCIGFFANLAFIRVSDCVLWVNKSIWIPLQVLSSYYKWTASTFMWIMPQPSNDWIWKSSIIVFFWFFVLLYMWTLCSIFRLDRGIFFYMFNHFRSTLFCNRFYSMAVLTDVAFC